MCYVPPHHASSQEHQIVSHVPHPSPASPTTLIHGSRAHGVAIMHHHTPVHAQQAHDIPADSERCADGDSELKSSEAYDIAADRLVTPTTSKYGN